MISFRCSDDIVLICPQFLHDGDVCNLGSINLERFARYPNGPNAPAELDEAELQRVARVAVRMLDNVVDLTDHPVERVNAAMRGNRRLGIGIMGFADLLFSMRVAYDSPEGRAVGARCMRLIRDAADDESRAIGARKGPFPNIGKSVWAGTTRRNAALTNVPPTGSISMLWDVSGGVEPYFSLAYTKDNILGGASLKYVNKHLEGALRAAGQEHLLPEILRTGRVRGVAGVDAVIARTFVTAMDISARDHILMQAAFQNAGCDNAISKTINFPNKATVDDVLEGYLTAWREGCKGTTVYRDGSRFVQILNAPADKPEEPKEPTEAAVLDACTLRGGGCA